MNIKKGDLLQISDPDLSFAIIFGWTFSLENREIFLATSQRVSHPQYKFHALSSRIAVFVGYTNVHREAAHLLIEGQTFVFVLQNDWNGLSVVSRFDVE